MLAIPTPKRILAIFDPMILAETISVRSFSGVDLKMETSDVESSGRLVPIPITVTPMIKWGIPNFTPSISAESIKKSADFTRRKSAKEKAKKGKNI
jgi:ribosomal protein L11